MCQCQLSSVEFASGAAIPPCAATVWERVGKTFDSTATFKLERASSSAARIPEPPAPTTMASNLRTCSVTSSPQNLYRPAKIGGDRQQDEALQPEPQPGRLDVVHQDVAHPHPGMPRQADSEQERRDAHPAL